MISLPVPTGPYWTQIVTLDGTDYQLTGRYSYRAERYYLDIGAPDGTRYASGKAVVCNWPLFLSCADDRLPAGRLFAVPQAGDDSDPKLGELGQGMRVELLYLTGAEVAAAKAT